MKRFCSMILAVTCLLIVMPSTGVYATTSDGFTCFGGNLYAEITGYTGTDPDIEIPSKIGGRTITGIADSAFSNNKIIKSVTIEGRADGRVDIGDYAFSSCTNLTSVTISGAIGMIGESAFVNCSNLTSVTISGGVNTIGNNAFYNCKTLERVDVTDLETWCGILFWNETANPLYYAKNLHVNGEMLTELVVPDTVCIITQYLFYNAPITSITFHDKVHWISTCAFYNTAIEQVTIPGRVEYIGSHAFDGCEFLTDVYYEGSPSGWEVLSKTTNPVSPSATVHILGEDDYLTNVVAMLDYTVYENGTARITDYHGWETDLVIPSEIDGYTVTSVGFGAFQSNSNLVSVTIPDSVSHIEGYAFNGCSKLTSVTVGKGVTFIGEQAFAYCSALEKVNIPDVAKWCNITFVEVTSTIVGANPLYNNADLYLNGELVTELVIPDGVTAINNAFVGCESITGVVIPKSVTSIDSSAFYKCTNLTDVYYEGSKEEWPLISGKYFPSTVTIHYDWAELMQGDLTGDGIVDMFDAMALYTAVSGAGTLTEAQELAADINADGTIDMFDALALYIQVSGQ